MSSMVGVDLGGTNVRVALGDKKGKITSILKERTDKSHGPEGISLQIIRMIQTLHSIDNICYIGLGSAGPLDVKNGSIVNSPHIGFTYIPLVKPLEDEFHVPVYLANDCIAGVVAEKEFGSGKDYENLVYVTISTGIGGGVFVDGHLLLGKDGNAHEIGHITIDQLGQLTCGCGKKGHWEAYCGGSNASNFIKLHIENKTRKEFESSLLYTFSQGDINQLSSEKLFELAKQNDKLALELVNEIGRLNAMGFASITNVYDPELIILGGAIPLAHPNLIIQPIKKLINQYNINRIPIIQVTELGEDIVLYGSLALSKYLP